jgi:uncharacterized membrane protein YdjX (TVP38/TMEM64 family)
VRRRGDWKRIIFLAILAASIAFGAFSLGRLANSPPAEALRRLSAFSDHWLHGRRALVACVFALTHIAVSFTSFPGCTVLNLFAGYFFGFARGCLLVYPVTMASAALGYFAGRSIPSFHALLRRDSRWSAKADELRSALPRAGLPLLVSLRFSPLIPFGALNLVMGWSRVSIPVYFLSTFFGIVFDVLLLNWIGSSLKI